MSKDNENEEVKTVENEAVETVAEVFTPPTPSPTLETAENQPKKAGRPRGSKSKIKKHLRRYPRVLPEPPLPPGCEAETVEVPSQPVEAEKVVHTMGEVEVSMLAGVIALGVELGVKTAIAPSFCFEDSTRKQFLEVQEEYLRTLEPTSITPLHKALLSSALIVGSEFASKPPLMEELKERMRNITKWMKSLFSRSS